MVYVPIALKYTQAQQAHSLQASQCLAQGKRFYELRFTLIISLASLTQCTLLQYPGIINLVILRAP